MPGSVRTVVTATAPEAVDWERADGCDRGPETPISPDGDRRFRPGPRRRRGGQGQAPAAGAG
jgi:hypothetical protein